MLEAYVTYQDTMRAFSWNIPGHDTMGVDVCDKWADGSGRLARIVQEDSGEVKRISFDALKDWSSRFALALRAAGVKRGDRVGVLLLHTSTRA